MKVKMLADKSGVTKMNTELQLNHTVMQISEVTLTATQFINNIPIIRTFLVAFSTEILLFMLFLY